jgi:hypothetical protein
METDSGHSNMDEKDDVGILHPNSIQIDNQFITFDIVSTSAQEMSFSGQEAEYGDFFDRMIARSIKHHRI